MWNRKKGAGKWCPENDGAYQAEMAAMHQPLTHAYYRKHFMSEFDHAGYQEKIDEIIKALDAGISRSQLEQVGVDRVLIREAIREREGETK